jgi:hypothetical protein
MHKCSPLLLILICEFCTHLIFKEFLKMQNLLYSFALGINYDANNVPQIYFENFLNSILIKRSGSVLQ